MQDGKSGGGLDGRMAAATKWDDIKQFKLALRAYAYLAT